MILLIFFQEMVWTRGGRKQLKKCPPAGTDTKVSFPRVNSKVGSPSEGHNPPRGSPRDISLSEGFSEASAGVSFGGALRGSARVRGTFQGQSLR